MWEKKYAGRFYVGLNELVLVCHFMRRKYWKLCNLVTQNDNTLTLTAMSIKKKDKRHRVFQKLDAYVKK